MGSEKYDGFMWPVCVIQRTCVESVLCARGVFAESVLWGRRQYDGFMWPVCVIQRTCVESVLCARGVFAESVLCARW